MKNNKLFKSLKVRLGCTSAFLILIIAFEARLAARGHVALSIVFAIIAVALVVLTNFWFIKNVTGPISKLTESAHHIAEGRYGIQVEKNDDNEIGELTDEINDMSEKIAIADKVRTEFISQVSHELRTPLTAITGWSETLGYDESLNDDAQKGLQIITKEAQRLTGMVEELLEFTRIQDGRFNLRIELIDITAELEDALFTYGKLMKQSGMQVNYSPPDYEIPLIPGDPERLKQVFLNVLDNAAKHGGDGNAIDVSIILDSKYVTINIRDYGKGIPEDELPHVKEKFYKGSSKDRGNGIGLSVCDEIVTRHGGLLTIENVDGGGCLVGIKLPIKQN